MATELQKSDLSIFERTWLFFCKLFTFIYLRWRIYQTISYIHERIFDRMWDHVVIPIYDTMSALVLWMRDFSWHKDGMIEFLDAICTPRKVQAIGRELDNTVTYVIFWFFRVKLKHGNDCDEAARYVAYCINKSLLAGKMKDATNLRQAYILTITWMERGGKVSGHNVALLQYVFPLMSGGIKEQWAFMDYDKPSMQFDSIAELVNYVRSVNSGWDSVGSGKAPYIGCTWCMSDADSLSPIYAHWD